MLFNSDPMKQAVEIAFSTTRIFINHTVFKFNNVPVAKVDEHKHFGMILYSKVSLASHTQAATLTVQTRNRNDKISLDIPTSHNLRAALKIAPKTPFRLWWRSMVRSTQRL